jgi:hypothetical protein
MLHNIIFFNKIILTNLMKVKLAIFSSLVFLFILFLIGRFIFLDQRNATGELKVVSSPTASVFINNVVIGKTPFFDKYKVGEYVIKIIPEGTATEAASWQGKINIYKNALTYVNRELGSSDVSSAGEVYTTTKMEKAPSNKNYGEIYVETEPQGAIVYLDNDEKGVAPLILADVLKGTHELSVSMPNFIRRTQKINVDSGYRVSGYVKLSIDQTQPSIIKKETGQNASGSASLKDSSVLIKDTPTGWLRVRVEPSIDASEAARVKPGEKYPLLEEQGDWYKIRYEDGKEGWISSSYSEKQTP